MEFKERLKYALEARDIKAIDLSDKLGVARGTVSRYLSGAMVPKSKRIYTIAQILHVNPAWLMGYDVPMNPPEVREDYDISIQLMYDQLDDDEKRAVKAMLSGLIAQKDKNGAS